MNKMGKSVYLVSVGAVLALLGASSIAVAEDLNNPNMMERKEHRLKREEHRQEREEKRVHKREEHREKELHNKVRHEHEEGRRLRRKDDGGV